MAIARFAPDALTTQTNLTGSLANIQDDPDAPDGNWLVATSNNVTVTAHVTFPNPPGALTPGAGLQEFRALVRKTGTSGTGTPTAQIHLYENGALISSGTNTNVTSTVGQVLSYTWDGTGRNPANIECRVVGTLSGGGVTVRAAVDIGAVEWNVDHSVMVTGIASQEAVPSPAISFALQEVTGAGAIASGEALGAPVVLFTSPYPTGIPSGEAFGTPRTQLAVTGAGAIASAEALGSLTALFTSPYPTGIPSGEAFGTPSIQYLVRPTGVPTEEAVPAPVILKVGIFPPSITSAEAIGSPVVYVNAVFVQGIASAEAFGSITFQLFMPPIRPTGIPSELVLGLPTIANLEWWTRVFPYRRRLPVQALTETVPIGHPVDVFVPLDVTQGQGKVREDLADVEVVYMDGAGQWRRLGRDVAIVGDAMRVRFLTWDPIPAGEEAEYFLHYGAPGSEGVGRPAFVDNQWAIVESHDGGRISFTRPTEDWRDGVSQRRGAQAALEFAGTSVRIVGVRSPDGGIAEVQLDGGPWESVDFFSITPVTEQVFAATDLSPGHHKIRIRAAGRANPGSRGHEVQVMQMAYLTDVSVLPEKEEINVAVEWGGGGLGGG